MEVELAKMRHCWVNKTTKLLQRKDKTLFWGVFLPSLTNVDLEQNNMFNDIGFPLHIFS